MILSTTDYTEAERRTNIRELAGITVGSYNDAELDEKIKNADAITLALFNVSSMPTENTRNFLTVSNIQTAILILHGLPEDSAQPERIRELRATADRVLKAINQTHPAQTKTTTFQSDTISQGQGTII